MTDMFNPMPNT